MAYKKSNNIPLESAIKFSVTVCTPLLLLFACAVYSTVSEILLACAAIKTPLPFITYLSEETVPWAIISVTLALVILFLPSFYRDSCFCPDDVRGVESGKSDGQAEERSEVNGQKKD
jgi:hypothetical protein